MVQDGAENRNLKFIFYLDLILYLRGLVNKKNGVNRFH